MEGEKKPIGEMFIKNKKVGDLYGAKIYEASGVVHETISQMARKFDTEKIRLITERCKPYGIDDPMKHIEMFERKIDDMKNENIILKKDGQEYRIITFRPLVTETEGGVPKSVSFDYY